MKIECLALMLALAAHQACVADTDLRACRAIADKSARLACYDALPLPAAAVPAATTAAAPMPAAQTVARAAAPAAPASTPAEQFGLSTAQLRQVDTLETEIMGRFEGWRPKQMITLANGQVWRISDDSSAVYNLQNPRVTIRRGMLGAFYLEVEGVNQSPRVRRER